MLKKCFKSSKSGFTLIEALIAVNLIGISIYFGSSAINQLTKIKANSQLYTNVNLAKRNLISILQNNTAWINTINANGTEFDCLKNITGSLADGGCELKSAAAGYPFIIYNDSNGIFYDPLNSSTAGFDNKGDVCNTFDGVNGNPACPYRATVRWRPICDFSPGVKCFQPAIEIFGEIAIKKNTSAFAIQKTSYAYQIIRPYVNCPAQAINFQTTSAQWAENPAASSGTINGAYLTTTDAATPPNMYFEYQTQVFSCDDHTLNFKNRINISGGASATDPENTSTVCLTDPNQSNLCLYEWRQAQTSWSLWQRNLTTNAMELVYTKPVGTKPANTDTTVYSFTSKKGQIQFYVDSELYYIFSNPWLRNYSYKIRPAPTNYSFGIEPY